MLTNCCIRVVMEKFNSIIPIPRPLLNQIILPDPTQLQRDFANVSVSEIIQFLSEAGRAE